MPEGPMTSREHVPHANVPLAIDLTSEAVSLLERDVGGDWAELGRVPLAGGGFRAGIDALRRAAEERGSASVTILLPAEQITVRRYVFGRRSGDCDEARRRIAEDTGLRADELTLALSPAGEGELVTVLAASRRTVEEALDYAGRWGFRPEAVSTRVAAGRFGAAGPIFALPEAAPRRAGLRRAAAAAAVLALALGAWGAQGLMPIDDPVDKPGSTHALATDAAEPLGETRPNAGAPASPPAAPGLAANAGRKPTRATGPEQEQPRASPQDRQIAGSGSVPILATRAEDRPAKAPEASKVSRQDPGPRPQPTAPPPAADLAPLMAGIESIKPERWADEEAVLLAASDVAPARVPGRPVPRPVLSDAVSDGSEHEGEEHVEGEVVETEGSDTPAIDIDGESHLAAISAPRPAARPERANLPKLAHRFVFATPPRVGNAASQIGLTLDATNLIGVIDAHSGREALLRMPSGDFRKVTRGDTVAGWRVSEIGPDTMRLTRGAESRTLLLVTR